MNPNNIETPNEPTTPEKSPIDTSELFQKDPAPYFVEPKRKTVNKKLLPVIIPIIILLLLGGFVFAQTKPADDKTSDKQSSEIEQEDTDNNNSDTAQNTDAESRETEESSAQNGDTPTSSGDSGDVTNPPRSDNPSPSPSPSPITIPAPTNTTHTITHSNSCYSPQNLSIKKGDTINFVNSTSSKYMWPASDNHPSHNIYSEFDPGTDIAPGSNWSFKFTNTGTWGYHDHNKPSCSGIITVV